MAAKRYQLNHKIHITTLGRIVKGYNNYLFSTMLREKNQVALFITCLGPTVDGILKNLVCHEESNKKSHSDMKSILKHIESC